MPKKLYSYTIFFPHKNGGQDLKLEPRTLHSTIDKATVASRAYMEKLQQDVRDEPGCFLSCFDLEIASVTYHNNWYDEED